MFAANPENTKYIPDEEFEVSQAQMLFFELLISTRIPEKFRGSNNTRKNIE